MGTLRVGAPKTEKVSMQTHVAAVSDFLLILGAPCQPAECVRPLQGAFGEDCTVPSLESPVKVQCVQLLI